MLRRNHIDTYCRATLNYADGETQVNPVQVDIVNARTRDGLTWQDNGFELFKHTSAVTDWNAEDQIVQNYYAEMELQAQQLTGCDYALIAGHICRNPSTAAKHQDNAPIQYVHSDFTASYGDTVRDRYMLLEEDGLQALQRAGIGVEQVMAADRILILQFWRNVGAAEMDLPLAICDAKSVTKEDLIAFHVPEYGGQRAPFDTFGVSAPLLAGDHDWYVYPHMQLDEVLAFRTYDSARVKSHLPYWTPHAAFRDPHAHATQSRHSIEVRATCLFDT